MTSTIVEELLVAAIGLSGSQVVALKLGAMVVSDLLKRPQATPGVDPSVLSSTPGRIRLCASGLKGSVQVARRIEERLGELPGMQRVVASPITGTVLAIFDPEQLRADVIARAVRLSGMALRVSEPDPEYRVATLEATSA